jgi:hypothetical protein
MTTAMTKRLARAVLIAGLALPAMMLLPANAPFAITKAHAEATTVAEFKSVLANYGKWGTHEKYGDIWVPTVTPQGWHPYPACQWAYTKDGWYFNDNTEWGAIVHHYGRWSHDEQIGWFWVPDQDWSPGWVVWRKSDKWVGWAPMPPEQDYQLVSSDAFNNDKLWIFMEAQKFLNGDCGNAASAVSVSASQAYYETNWTSLFDLPPGLLVDIIYVPHWKVKVIAKLIPVFIPYCPPPIRTPPLTGGNPPPSVSGPPARDIKFHFDPPTSIKGGRTSNDTPPPDLHITNNPGVKIDLPSVPGRGPKGRGGHDDSGGSSKGTHLGTVSLGHTVTLGSTMPVRAPTLAIGPRVSGLGLGAKGGFRALR